MKNVIVTGGHGFLGRYVIKELNKENILSPTHKECDLKKESDIKKLFSENKEYDTVIHLAAKVGGISFNQEKSAELFYDNLIMGIQLMEHARIHGIKKFVTVGTVCSYPKYTQIPFREEHFWNGYPEETNAPYGLAKKMLLVQGQAYKQQYGFNAIYLILSNLYGPGDNFNPESSHVIPALIKKVYEAKETNQKSVTVWGDGLSTREFLYVEDAAKAIVLAARTYNRSDPINVGTGVEISIRDLVFKISEILKYKGDIEWDTSKPNGQPRRCLDVTKLNFKARTTLDKGLKKTINWYNSIKKEK